MYEFIYEHFIIRWCPEAYGQWTLDSSTVGWWKVPHAASLHGEAKTMVVEARKKGTWVLLQNCHLYKKLGWHCSPCFTQLHILTQAPHHPCCLLSSNSPSLLAVRQSRLHTYSRLFKLAVLAIDYYLLSFLQVLRFICSLTQALIRENAAATIKEHGFFKSWQASNNFRLWMTFLYTVLMLVTFQIVDYTHFFKSYLSFLCYQSF